MRKVIIDNIETDQRELKPHSFWDFDGGLILTVGGYEVSEEEKDKYKAHSELEDVEVVVVEPTDYDTNSDGYISLMWDYVY